MLPTRTFEMVVSRSCFPWGRCLIREGPGMGLWGPIFSHLITMPSSLVSLSYVNAGWVTRILISLGNTREAGLLCSCFKSAEWTLWLSLNIPKPEAAEEWILHLANPEMYGSVWLLALNGFRLNNWETAYSRGCSWGIICFCVVRKEKRIVVRQ